MQIIDTSLGTSSGISLKKKHDVLFEFLSVSWLRTSCYFESFAAALISDQIAPSFALLTQLCNFIQVSQESTSDHQV